MISYCRYFVSTCLLFLSLFVQAQDQSISGIIIQKQNGLSLEGVEVRVEGETNRAISKITGYFSLPVRSAGMQTVFFNKPGYRDLQLQIEIKTGENYLGEIAMEYSDLFEIEDLSLLPTISIDSDDADFADGSGTQDISSVLTASRDVFVSTASFVFGPARFRIRGYGPEYTGLMINGIPLNDPETGIPFFWQLGGLNDVLRARDINIGINPVSYGFGDVGGISNIDLRPSRQWAQTRVSYALANRAYRHRLMATHNTGMMKNGWAFSFSGSRRWANEGYIPGTFYDAWSYFLGAEKRINEAHSLSLVVYGAPTIRGGAGPAIQELYDIAGTNFYNPNWGWQEGRKRNARVSNAHIPTAILRHDFKISNRASLTTSMSYQFGRNGFGALNWDEAGDPRPDYYQKLPSFVQDPQLAQTLREYMVENPELLQLDWESFYRVNRNNKLTIEDVDGIPGNSVNGNLAKYFLEERRIDNRIFNAVSYYEHFLTDRMTLNTGVSFRHFTGKNFRVMADLLGADFYLNEDRFTRIDFPNDPSKWENNVDNPRQLLKEGDRFGYDYDANIRQGSAWIQLITKLRKVDMFLSVNGSGTSYWRTGNLRNGRFPDNSFGDSEKIGFINYSVKAGITYKIDGRQYLYGNLFTGTRPPIFRNVFISPRTRDQLNPGYQSEQIHSAEFGYIIRTPRLKARASAYYTLFNNQSNIVNYFQDAGVDFDDDGESEGGGLVNFVLNDVNKQHAGIELAVDYNLNARWSLAAVASLGDFIFTNRPNAYITLDNSSEPIADNLTIYAKNFFVSRTPQQAFSLGLNYRSPKFWYLNINFNYYAKNYLDFNPLRRTSQAVIDLEPGNELRNEILFQEKLPDAFTIDVFGGKSWKIKRNFVYLNVGIGNLLNNTNFITSGYEQYRYDFAGQNPNRFPTRYFYAFGFNYFLNLAYRF